MTSFDAAKWERKFWYDTLDACGSAIASDVLAYGPSGLKMSIFSTENYSACQSGGEQFSWSHLDSGQIFGIAVGNGIYFEATIKAAYPATGTLTAFWLLPSSGAWPPEIDIIEIRGDVPNSAYMTNHWSSSNQQQQAIYSSPDPLYAAYHRYGCSLSSTQITWYIDGIQRAQMPLHSGENTTWFPILDLYTGDCGDGWAGCPGVTTGWRADAYVKNVQVWKKP